jgi:hypothetical protein
MTQIVLDDHQAETLQAATGVVEVRDQHGNLLGYLSRPPSDAEIAEARRRLESAGPWHTTQQVLGHLKSLVQQ